MNNPGLVSGSTPSSAPSAGGYVPVAQACPLYLEKPNAWSG